MLGLPHSTVLSKQLPKKAIYSKFGMKGSEQESFDLDISRITIVGEVSEKTTSIVSGADVSSFYVVSVLLKRREFSEGNIILLSRLIPHRILFALLWEDEVRLAVYSTELLCSDWQPLSGVSIDLSGLNLDVVWDNLLIGIGGITIEGGNSVVEQLALDAQRARLQKKIEQLERKKRREPQFNKQIAISAEIKKLKEML